MRGLKFVYSPGFVRARFGRPPRGVPAADTIELTFRKGRKGGGVTVWLRPDEAVAAASTLCAAVWDAELACMAVR